MKTIKELYESEADNVAVQILRDAKKFDDLKLGENYWTVHSIIKNLIIGFYEDHLK